MISGATFVHTNMIARDWRALAAFYQSVFGCVPVPPERNFSGPTLEAGTGLKGAAVEGVHLRLPGSDAGPTLEIFTYTSLADSVAPAVNRPGFAHIAFAVDAVRPARAEVLAAGGTAVGDIVTLEIAGGTRITWCYVRDPEGNIIELQSRVTATT